jgi:hypothetical protein
MSKRLSALLAVGSAVAALFLYAAPAQAQATRTWVSGVGDDVNPCSRTAPCKTFAGAISKTAVNGEINCLDPGGFGTVTITKSLTIDCTGTFGSILNSGGINAVNIPFDNFLSAGETRKTVRLRGLAMNGAAGGASTTGVGGVRITGGAGAVGSEVFIEDVVIDGNFASGARGINDLRTQGGLLSVSNTTVRNILTFGINVGPNTTGFTKVVLDNVRVYNVNDNQFAANVKATIRRSVFSGNAGIGVFATSSQVHISESTISHNLNGVFTAAGATLTLSDVDLVFNDTAVGGGAVSFGNNRIQGNGSDGAALTAAAPGLR